MGRGRPAVLKDRKTTSVSLESWQAAFILEKGIDLSKFVRDNIDALMQSGESPIEQLERENKELKQEIQDREIRIRQNEAKIKELRETQTKEEEEGRLQNEFEEKRKEYVIGCIKSMRTQNTCNNLWLGHLRDVWKFPDFDEAKNYVRNVWIEEGVPEKKVRSYLRMN